MVEAAGWSVFDWMTGTGWKIEIDGAAGAVRGKGRKRLGGDVLHVDGEAASVEELAWTLLERAATALEQAGDRQGTAVAA